MNLDWQKRLENAVQAERAEALKTSQQITLGELILKLESVADKNLPVVFDDSRYHPTGIESWRGSYAELAIEYAEDGEKLSVDGLLQLLKKAVGSTFFGYKGGEFLMGRRTPVWVANYGKSHGFLQDEDVDTQAVIDVLQDGQNVIIETRLFEY